MTKARNISKLAEGVSIDNITIDGNEIDVSSGHLTLDVGGEIILDASDGIIKLKDDGTEFGRISLNSNNLRFYSDISNGDILFQGNDGGSFTTALTLDMSDAGTAIFNHDVKLSDDSKAIFGAGSNLQIYYNGTHSYIEDAGSGDLILKASDQIKLQNASGQNMAVFNENGAVLLTHSESTKLATTATGIDVTGTVTSDGLTVDGNAVFSNGDNSVLNGDDFAKIQLKSVDSSTNSTGIMSEIADVALSNFDGASNNHELVIRTNNGLAATGTLRDRINIANNGDISFYEDTGTTPKFRWDASTERLGIGTSAPADKLHVEGNIYLGASSRTVYTGGAGNLSFQTNTGEMFFLRSNGSAESMRIDGSGNVLVGTTDDQPFNNSAGSTADNGLALKDNGQLQVAAYKDTANTGSVVYFNRTSTDGTILDFRKDGATIGGITATQGRMAIGNGDTGLKFSDSNESIMPFNVSTNANRDNAVDLGYTTVRFKDLHLSGTAYAGTAGIGTSSITSGFKMEVIGDARFGDAVGDDAVELGWSAGGSQGFIQAYDRGASAFRPLILNNSMTIDSSGNVGVNKAVNSVVALSVGADSTATNSYGLEVTNASANTRFLVDGVGSSFFYKTDNAVGIKFDSSSGNVGIGSTRTDRGLLNINHDNTGDAFNSSHIALTYDVSPTDNNSKAGITYATSDSDNYGYFQGAERTTSGQGAFVLRYHNNSASGTERMRIDSSGRVGIGTTAPAQLLEVSGNGGKSRFTRSGSSGTAMEFYFGGTQAGGIQVQGTGLGISGAARENDLFIDSSGKVGINGDPTDLFYITGKATSTAMGIKIGTNGYNGIEFDNATGSLVGRITINSGTTAYITSSDYRLKENVTDMTGATTRLKQLKPKRFNWIADDTNALIDGFLAHEVSSVVPEAVSGEKDAVHPEGHHEAGEIDPQGIDHSKLVPLLVKTIQELEARITALEA